MVVKEFDLFMYYKDKEVDHVFINEEDVYKCIEHILEDITSAGDVHLLEKLDVSRSCGLALFNFRRNND